MKLPQSPYSYSKSIIAYYYEKVHFPYINTQISVVKSSQ